MDLGRSGYNFDDKRVVLLCVVRFFLVLSVFYNRFENLLVTLGVCRWGGRCVLFRELLKPPRLLLMPPRL